MMIMIVIMIVIMIIILVIMIVIMILMIILVVIIMILISVMIFMIIIMILIMIILMITLMISKFTASSLKSRALRSRAAQVTESALVARTVVKMATAPSGGFPRGLATAPPILTLPSPLILVHF